MKKTGLNVSYDTILRGILKPSELRLLDKQRKNSNVLEVQESLSLIEKSEKGIANIETKEKET